MPRTMTSRALFAALLEEEVTEEVQDSEVRAPISRQVLRKLLSEYGRTPVIVGAFNLYADLKDRFEDQVDGIEPPEGTTFYTDFRRAMRLLDSRVGQEGTRQYLSEAGTRIENLLRRLDNGHELSSGLWRDLIQQYAGVIQALSADKGIFTRTRRLPGGGAVRWLRIQKANPREEAKEKFRTEDPELYARLERGERQIREMNVIIHEKVVQDGLVPEKRLFNRFKGGGTPAMTGRDPVTDEVLVYDIDGEVLSPDEFEVKLRAASKHRRSLGRINPAHKMKPHFLDGLREYDAEEIQDAVSERRAEFERVRERAEAHPESERLRQRLQELSPKYVSLTDDPDKESAVTRVYPVVDIGGREVVSSGRYAGMPKDALINSVGRQLEGSVTFRSRYGDKTIRRSVTDAQGNVTMRRLNETYVTVEKGRLFIRTSPAGPYKEIRHALAALAKRVPTIVKAGPSAGIANNFYFDPKDFSTIQDAVGTMALSSTANKLLEDYFEDLARAERAANATDLDRYSAESLGMRFPLRYQQARALAWLDANGNKGICALDTGMGKTAVAIGSMINLLKQGKRGRFLFVCDTDLLGNLPKEIRKFLQPEEAAAMEKLVDVISYTEFSKMRRNDPDYGEQYVAIYWDEAHTKMNKKSKSAYEAAVNCPCEHKILLTASPMVKDPKEVYTMASVANSQDLRGRTPASKAEIKFLDYYSTTVAGRTVGITQDPIAAKSFRTWVKRNLFYAEKTAVIEEEAKLEKLIKETIAITMEPDVAEAYLVEMAAVGKELKELTRDVRKSKIPAGNKSTKQQRELINEWRKNPALVFEKAQTRQSRPLKMLTMLSDTPDLVPGLEGARNPKVDASVAIIAPKMQIDGARTLMFAESKALAEQTFSRMRTEYSGVGHVLGLKNAIYYSGASGEVTKYTKSNFGRHVGKRDEKGKLIRERNAQTNKLEYINPLTNEPLNSDEWKTYILGQVLGLKKTRTDKNIRTAVLTGSYAVGQNLQSFGTVIHMDRDTWSNETMKQRTARAWRAGNKQKVEEYTLDMVLPVTMEPAQESLDQMRKTMQEIDSDLFNSVVLDSQVEKLGEEWYNMKRERSALAVVDRKMIERALSPYAKHIGSLEDMNNA